MTQDSGENGESNEIFIGVSFSCARITESQVSSQMIKNWISWAPLLMVNIKKVRLGVEGFHLPLNFKKEPRYARLMLLGEGRGNFGCNGEF